MTVARLERLPVREVWKREASDFTTWLVDHIDVLDEVLTLGLTNAKREQDAGDLRVDVVAEDGTGEVVVIENQLGKSDHDHLGKMLTYLAMYEAKKAVWIVGDPRSEHVKATSWLNESGLAKFYLVKLEAIRIADSAPAALFTLVIGPSEEATEAGNTKKEIVGRHDSRLRFWTGLLEKAKHKTQLHENISPGTASWVAASAGRPGLRLTYVIREHTGQIELYIDFGQESGQRNKEVFRFLEGKKSEIENAYGKPLNWEYLESRRASRISDAIELGGWKDEEAWPRLQDAMIESMIRFERALRPHIEALPRR